MGYSSTKPLSFFEWGNYRQTRTDLTVSTVSADRNLGFLYFPSFLSGIITHAYLDVYFPYCRNSSGSDNWFTPDQYFQVQDTLGGAWTNAIILKSSTYNFPTGETIDAGRQTGYYNIANTCNIASGTGLYVRWHDAQANADSIVFKNIYFILRVST